LLITLLVVSLIQEEEKDKQQVKKLILAMLLTASGSVAFANSTVVINFLTLPSTQGNGTTNSQDNTYDGEAGATIGGTAVAELACDFFSASTKVPSGPLDYSVETLASLSGVQFTSGYAQISGHTLTEVQAYDTVALLMTELDAATPSGDAQTIADFQYAIWNLMLPNGLDGSIKNSPLDAAATANQVNAFAAVTATTPAAQTTAAERALVIYTPTSQSAGNQEFLGLNTPMVNPEPSTWLLLAGLGLLLWVPQVRHSLLRTVLSRS
jgi:hypothetical protein